MCGVCASDLVLVSKGEVMHIISHSFLHSVNHICESVQCSATHRLMLPLHITIPHMELGTW